MCFHLILFASFVSWSWQASSEKAFLPLLMLFQPGWKAVAWHTLCQYTLRGPTLFTCATHTFRGGQDGVLRGRERERGRVREAYSVAMKLVVGELVSLCSWACWHFAMVMVGIATVWVICGSVKKVCLHVFVVLRQLGCMCVCVCVCGHVSACMRVTDSGCVCS